MPLARGETRGHVFNRNTYLFTMLNGNAQVLCAVSGEAMDDCERGSAQNHERDAQFQRLRDKIEECASRKFFAGRIEASDPAILITTRDLNG
jgi:hypothetical protein